MGRADRNFTVKLSGHPVSEPPGRIYYFASVDPDPAALPARRRGGPIAAGRVAAGPPPGREDRGHRSRPQRWLTTRTRGQRLP
jgi:hypothetical protein